MFVRTWRHFFLHNCTPHIFGIQKCVNSFSAIETTLKAGDFRIQVVHLWYDHQVLGGWLKKNVFGNTRWLWPVLFMDPEWSEWCGLGLGFSWLFLNTRLRRWISPDLRLRSLFRIGGVMTWSYHLADRRETPGWNHPAKKMGAILSNKGHLQAVKNMLGGNWLGPSPARHSHEKSSAMAAPPTHASGRQKTLPWFFLNQTVHKPSQRPNWKPGRAFNESVTKGLFYL